MYAIHSIELGTQIKSIWQMDEEGKLGILKEVDDNETYICFGNWSYFVDIKNKIDLTLPGVTLKQCLEELKIPHDTIKAQLEGIWLLYYAAKKGDAANEDG